jgi:histidinol-phosphatase (PHP family)
MMIQDFSYHNHTNFSDGADSLTDIVKQAKTLGFSEMGISDHLIVHKNMHQGKDWELMAGRPYGYIFNADFSQILEKYQRHCDEIRRVAKEENFKLYVGFEVDFFTYDGWLEELKYFLSQLDYDYIINGNHMLFDEKCENLFDLSDLRRVCSDSALYHDYLSRHFATMKKAVESGVFKFLAHIDYARKLGEDICGENDFIKEKTAVLSALEEAGMATEISTKGLRKIGDFYPCKWILDELAARHIPVVISDDAHRVAELGYKFAEAEDVLAKHNVFNRLHF